MKSNEIIFKAIEESIAIFEGWKFSEVGQRPVFFKYTLQFVSIEDIPGMKGVVDDAARRTRQSIVPSHDPDKK